MKTSETTTKSGTTIRREKWPQKEAQRDTPRPQATLQSDLHFQITDSSEWLSGLMLHECRQDLGFDPHNYTPPLTAH